MKTTLKLIISAILSSAIFCTSAGAAAFTDTEGHWAEVFIDEMTSSGYLSGYPDGTFCPDDWVSTGEYASILTRVFDLPVYFNTENFFYDVPDNAWYAPYAASLELLSPNSADGMFYGDEPVTRFYAAFTLSALYNFEVSYSNSAAAMADYDTFASDSAVGLVISTALDNGIMYGTDAGFEPYKALTRAELCAVIWRCAESIGTDRADGMKAVLAQIIDSLEVSDNYGGGYVPEPEYTPDPDVSDESLAREVLRLTNERRAEAGLDPLEWDDKLAEAARSHSEDMAARGFFDHDNPDGKSPFDRMDDAGIAYMAAAENIAAGQRTPEAVVEAWMNSPGHRANILSPEYRKLGVGVAYGGEYNVYWTQDFTD